MSFTSTFFQSVAGLIILIFCRAEIFNFSEVEFIHSFFHGSFLWCCVGKVTAILSHNHLGFLYVVFQEFIVLCFSFSYTIHFTSASVKGVRLLSGFFLFFFQCVDVVPTSFVENTIFALLFCLCSSVKNQFTLFMEVYFWVLYSVTLIYSPVL